MHTGQPKLHRVLAILSAIGLRPETILRHPACFPSQCSSSKMAELQVKGGNEDNSKLIFLYFNKNICCDPSLEPSQRDGSNDGSQHTFKRSNMENYPLIISFTPSYLEH